MQQIVEKRKWYYIISLILIIPGIISLLVQGLNLGIDFKGGSIVYIRLTNEATIAEVGEVIAGLKLGKAEIQKSGDQFYIRTGELNQEETNQLMDSLKEKYDQVEFLSAESVGATIGKELTRNAFLAIVVSAILMLLYITFRFEWTFGVAAVLAIIHNVLVVVGAFSLFQWEVNSAFIAAVLTVIGFSINDTIVVFDRVRENMRHKRRQDYTTLLNTSILQTMNRSINTVLTASFPLVTLMIFGGESIKFFAVAMLIGFVVGAYSSIFIASPLWLELKNRMA